jgi:hypothetical protein
MMRHINVMAIGALSGAMLLAAPAFAINNLSCFKVTDRTPKATFEATLGSEMGGLTCTLKTPAKTACFSTTGTQLTPPASEGDQGVISADFLCYRARCSGVPTPGADVHDALGRRIVAVSGARQVCLPATAVPTSALPPPRRRGCHFSDGECTGTCPGGQRCGAVVGTGECGCQGVECGDADAPECAGFCSSAGEACIFSVTGCSCVRIP